MFATRSRLLSIPSRYHKFASCTKILLQILRQKCSSVEDFSVLSDPEFIEKTQANLKARRCDFDFETLLDLYSRYRSGETSLREPLCNLFLDLPNSTHRETPVGGPTDYKELYVHGEKRQAAYKLLDVVELTQKMRSDSPWKFGDLPLCYPTGHLRTKHVGYGTGNRTYYFGGPLAILESALVEFTLDKLAKAGFTMVAVPDVLPEALIQACGFQTRGSRSQVYKIVDSTPPHCLSGTAEMSLAGFCMNKSFGSNGQSAEGLCAVSRCYRQEVPNQEPALYRVHQFTKVEMFGITAPDQNACESMFDKIVNVQIDLFSDLNLHFRVLEMPTAELGNPAHRKIDIEAWMPGEEVYGEISSTSNCLDYQAKRLGIRWLSTSGERYAYTLNGTGCAVPRVIKALLETHQQKDGAFQIPKALLPYVSSEEKTTHLPGCNITFKRPLSKME